MHASFSSSIALVRTMCVAILALLLAAPLQAQGTSNQLPDPITTVELRRLMTLYVQPTDGEMASIEALHDDYQREFRLFRESDIEAFMKRAEAMMGTGIPSKAKMQEFSRDYDRINDQIAAIDNRFFDAATPLFGQERELGLKRARDARARSRVGSGLLGQLPFMMGGGFPDVSAMAIESRLPAALLSEMQGEMISYEDRLTSLARETASAGSKMFVKMIDGLEKAGFGEASQEEMMSDPEKMKRMMETIQAVMTEATKAISERSQAVMDLNRKTFRSIHSRLSGTDARKFRLKFVRIAYPEVPGDPASTERLLTLALRVRSLDDNTRASITAAYESWKTSDDALVDECIKLAEENRSKFAEMAFGGSADGQTKMMELGTKRTELGSKTLESVKPLLGDERMQKLFARASSEKEDPLDDTSDPEAVAEADPSAAPPGVGVRAGAEAEAELIAVNGAAGGQFQRMPLASIRAMAGDLGLDEGTKASVEMLHADYERKWESEVEVLRTALQTAQQSIWVWDEKAKQGRYDEAKRAEATQAQKALAAKVDQLDEALFHDVASVVGDGKDRVVAAARLGRFIETSVRAEGTMWSGMYGPDQQIANVVEVVRRADASGEDRVRLLAILGAKADEIIPGLRTALAEQQKINADLELAMSRFQESTRGDDEERDPAAMQRFAQEQMRLNAELSRAVAKQHSILDAAWEQVTAAADGELRDRLQLAFDKATNPKVYDDPRCATPLIDHALMLVDLTDVQRTELTALGERYRTEYVEFCKQMTPKRQVSQPIDADGMSSEYWKERMAAENARNKVRFDRDERGQRAISQLRRILSADQAKRVPGLATFDDQFKVDQFGRRSLE